MPSRVINARTLEISKRKRDVNFHVAFGKMVHALLIHDIYVGSSPSVTQLPLIFLYVINFIFLNRLNHLRQFFVADTPNIAVGVEKSLIQASQELVAM